MNTKRELYEELYERMNTAHDAGFNLEASWFAYAVIEDRLLSLLRNSGGELGSGPINRIHNSGAV